MDILTVLFFTAVFIFAVAIIEVVYLAYTESRFVEKRTVKKRLLYISAGGKHGQEKLINYRKSILKEVGGFQRFALSLPRYSELDKLLIKTKLPVNATIFIIFSIASGVIGFFFGIRFLPGLLPAIAISVVFTIAPYLALKVIERSYFIKFGDQLPDALDLLSRAVRSGNSLIAGLGIIADELDDPIRSEFEATVDEVNLGLTMKEAMENLCERVPISDLRFFSIAVLVQKETGGNIGEILDNISRLIRERIQFQRQVRAMTAEGRYSAGILIGLPIFMFLYMYLTNYDYIKLLWQEEMGHYMLYGAIILQIVGAFLIKRIVTIEI